jgi:hypothetical protein
MLGSRRISRDSLRLSPRRRILIEAASLIW